jgi:predicted aspartyl protease
MRITVASGLAFVSSVLIYRDNRISLNKMLIDSGSTKTVFKSDSVRSIGLEGQESDRIVQVRGVGGIEYVVKTSVDEIQVGELVVKNFDVQLGALDYGIEIDGIIGLDFLLSTGAVMNFKTMTIET